jgi:hypothetical protein
LKVRSVANPAEPRIHRVSSVEFIIPKKEVGF